MATVKTPVLLALLIATTAARHAPPAPPPVVAPVAATIKGGVEKWRAGDYPAAVAIWQPFAAAGDADALFNMGQAYKLGRGVAADPAVARDYYRRAAIKGHLPAQANLGIALFQAGEKLEAIKWLRTAADRGEARAQYVLGIAAFNGDGVPRSQSLGYGYLLRAQASGLPQAVTALGTIAPGLASGDRANGEAIAASLAAGNGVPTALAAATATRLIPGTPSPRATATLPIVTPPPGTTATSRLPIVTPPPAALASAVPARLPAPPQPAPGPVLTAAGPAATRPPLAAAAPLPTADKSLPPLPKPATPVPLREPSPAQADAAARLALPAERRDGVAPPPAVATVAIPASRPVPAEPLPTPTRTAAGLERAADPGRAEASAKPARAPAEPARVDVARVETTPPKPLLKPAAPLKPFEVAVDPTKKPDGWRVQLGAFSSRKLADAAWADVKSSAAPARPVFATDGPVTKLQMGPFASRDAAKAACTRLTAAGRACFVTQG